MEKFLRNFLVIITLISFVSCNNSKNRGGFTVAVKEVGILKLKPTTAIVESQYSALVKGSQDVDIRPRIDGFIQKIYVNEGDYVQKGKVLFSIDNPSADQNVASSSANIGSMEATVASAKINVDRLKGLVEKNIISDVQYQTAVNAYKTALAQLQQAKSGLANAKSVLSWTQVSAPVSGYIGTIYFREGNLVSSANVLTNLSNTDNVDVYFSMNEKSFIAFMKTRKGDTQQEIIKNLPEIELIMGNGDKYEEKGKIISISGIANSGTGSIQFKAQFPNKKGVLRSGFSGKVLLEQAIDSALVIPQEATKTQQDKRLAYKVVKGKVEQAIINVIPLKGGHDFAVVSGLVAGDAVIPADILNVAVGDSVTVRQSDK